MIIISVRTVFIFLKSNNSYANNSEFLIPNSAFNLSVFLFKVFLRLGLLEIFRI